VLEEALLAFPGSALIVSHDRYFLDRVATRIVYLDGEGGVREWPGDMSGLLEKLKEEKAPRARKPKPARRKSAARTKRSYNEQRELDALPDRIAALEAEVAAIDAKLADPEVYQRPDVKEITSRRKEASEELDHLLERWEELESIE
jgi:ATP-binding cassette subfamily F protein uup